MASEHPATSFDRLVLKNVRCFRSTTIELDPRLTVLIGENGAGKTTVVEALASLSSGDEGLPAFPLTRGTKSGEIALHDGGKRPAARWKSGADDASGRRLEEDRFLFAYGRYRRVFFPEEEDERASTRPERDLEELARRAPLRRTVTLFEPDNHLLRDLSRYLAALHSARQLDPRLESVWSRLNASLAELGHGIEGIVMERGKYSYIPKVMRNGSSWELRELSDGYQSILVVVLDLILRYIYLFPAHEDPLLGTAIVAIDEVDLHLHPRWQRTVVRQLTTLFPGTQFVLTTHSPAVVQGAIDRRWKVISLREENGQTVAHALTPEEMDQLDGAEIGSVLLEEKLFGVGSRYSPKYEAVEGRIDKIQAKMARGTASDDERKQVFQDLNTLQGLVVSDEERRADGSFMSQMSELRKALLEDLAAEIEKVGR